jgi:CheY-like chemotaxis protein
VARAVGRILLMDDEVMIHKAMGMMLTVMGHEVESAYDGAEALQCYQAGLEKDQPFDLVIMDLAVPGGMGGRRLLVSYTRWTLKPLFSFPAVMSTIR